MVLGLTATASVALAAEGGALMEAHSNIHDRASLQRGARLFFNYCVGCHSLHYMRYSRIATDLGLTKKEVMDNLNFTGAKFGEHAISAMPHADAQAWFGKAPPDLSLEVGAKGADWVYSYLNSFYLDPERPVGWNNTVFPNASMPNPLWELQGLQVAEYGKKQPGDDKPPIEKLELAQAGSMTPAQFQQATRDLTNFLQYVSEPAALQRQKIGIWVILYLVVFTLLALMLKREYWKDVH
jgi:ubiquinol-cytochrome c reductase cytochrome c1 subunit